MGIKSRSLKSSSSSSSSSFYSFSVSSNATIAQYKKDRVAEQDTPSSVGGGVILLPRLLYGGSNFLKPILLSVTGNESSRFLNNSYFHLYLISPAFFLPAACATTSGRRMAPIPQDSKGVQSIEFPVSCLRVALAVQQMLLLLLLLLRRRPPQACTSWPAPPVSVCIAHRLTNDRQESGFPLPFGGRVNAPNK